MNNKELYKSAFSKLHASGGLRTEEREMSEIRPKFRCSKAAFACMALALLLALPSGITYAATGGETANVIKAVRIWIDGEAVDGALEEREDGSYVIHMEPEQEIKGVLERGEEPDSAVEFEIQTGAETEAGIKADLIIDGETGDLTVELTDGETGEEGEGE